jgi:hypothetical protein
MIEAPDTERKRLNPRDIHLKSMLCHPSLKDASTQSNPLYPIPARLQAFRPKKRQKNSRQLIELQPFRLTATALICV